MTDRAYFKLGHAPGGVTHAARTYWGLGLCEAPLVRVDDHHQFTVAELARHVDCPACLDLARTPVKVA